MGFDASVARLRLRDQSHLVQILKGVEALPACQKLPAEYLPLDLADNATVHEFVQKFKARNVPLDILICNAGIMAPPMRCAAKNNIELQFQVRECDRDLNLTKYLMLNVCLARDVILSA